MKILETIIQALNSIPQQPQQQSSVEVFLNNRRTDKEQRFNCKKLYKDYKKSIEFTNAIANDMSIAANYLQFEEEVLETDNVFKDKGFVIIGEKPESIVEEEDLYEDHFGSF